MKVRPGIVFSSTAHAALLAYAIVGLSSAKPFETSQIEALPIEIISPEQFAAMKGSKTSTKVETPKLKAEKVAEAEPAPVEDDTPVAKEDVKAPPPPSAPPPDPVKAEAEPPPKPLPDPAKLEEEKAAKAEADAKAEKAAEEKAVAEKAAAKAAADKAAHEKAEKLAAQAADAERLAKAEAAEKAAKEKAEADKLAKAEADKAAKEKADAEKAVKLAAEKAAKDKAEKLAKLEADKAAKAKAEAEKKAAERKFDPNKIASLLGDKPSTSDSAMKDVRDPSRKANAARDTAPETTAGTSRGTATKLSPSQQDAIGEAIKSQVTPCWSPPIGATQDQSLVVSVKFQLNTDGTLLGTPTVTNASSNPAFRAAAGAAMRAIQRCAPIRLPAESYDFWRQVNMNFDPKELMGG